MMLRDKPGKTGKVYDFSRAALLAGSLMMSGCGAAAQAVRPQPQIVQPLRVSCAGFSYIVSEGGEMTFPITEHMGYSFRINRLSRGGVNADVRIPVAITDGSILAYMAPGFDGVEFTRENFQRAADAVCRQVSRVRLRNGSSQIVTADYRMTADMDAKTQFAVTLPVQPQLALPDLGVVIRLMFQAGAINTALGHVARMQEGTVSPELEPLMFSVGASGRDSSSLSAEGREYGGRVFRLDRSIDFGIEIIGSDNYLAIPIHIQQLVRQVHYDGRPGLHEADSDTFRDGSL